MHQHTCVCVYEIYIHTSLWTVQICSNHIESLSTEETVVESANMDQQMHLVSLSGSWIYLVVSVVPTIEISGNFLNLEFHCAEISCDILDSSMARFYCNHSHAWHKRESCWGIEHIPNRHHHTQTNELNMIEHV